MLIAQELTKLSSIYEENPTCAYCQTLFRPGDWVVFCPQCSLAHHEQCWADGGDHCSVHGCSGQGAIQNPSWVGEEVVLPSQMDVTAIPLQTSAPDIDLDLSDLGTKSYRTWAVVIFSLYALALFGSVVLGVSELLLLWPVALILNAVIRRKAKRMGQLAGHGVSGQGCLGFMFWVNVALIVIGVVIAFIALLAFS